MLSPAQAQESCDRLLAVTFTAVITSTHHFCSEGPAPTRTCEALVDLSTTGGCCRQSWWLRTRTRCGFEAQHMTQTTSVANGNNISTILFDLDGTLYPIENGYEDHVRHARGWHPLTLQLLTNANSQLLAGKTFLNSCIRSLELLETNVKPYGDHCLLRQIRV